MVLDGLDEQTTQQLLGPSGTLPAAPSLDDQVTAEHLVGRSPGLPSSDRPRRFSVFFEGLEMQDMERMLQDHRENPESIEVNLDGFDAADELSMFLDGPEPKPFTGGQPKQQQQRLTRKARLQVTVGT